MQSTKKTIRNPITMTTHHKTNEEAIDPKSAYYRVCPECDKEFMAKNMLEIYCCKHHKDRHNNRIRREKEIAKRLFAQEKEELFQNGERQRKYEWASLQLKSLGIDRQGKIIHMDSIRQLKIDLTVFDGRYAVKGTPDAFYITIDNFHICKWNEDSLLIQNHNIN